MTLLSDQAIDRAVSTRFTRPPCPERIEWTARALINREFQADRITVILVNEVLGF